MKNLILLFALLVSSALSAANVGNPVTVYPSGTPIPVVVTSGGTPIPTPSGGAASAANQTTQITAANSAAGSLTTIAGTYSALSRNVVAMTTAYSVNITTAAGASGACEFCIGSIGANNFWYAWSNSATPPATYSNMFQVSGTPVCKNNLSPGTHLHLSVTAVALSATVEVDTAVRQ